MSLNKQQSVSGSSSVGGGDRTLRRLLFDVTGVVHWYAFFSHPSGIQRVTEKLISSPALRHNVQVEFVARMLGSNTFYRIDAECLADLDRPHRRGRAIARLRGVFAQSMRLAGLGALLADLRYYHIPYVLLGRLRLDALVEWFFARRWPDPLPPLQPVAPPGPSDILFNPGDLWWQKNYVSVVIELQAKTGVRLLQMIHDLFVIERPEWFRPGFARLFTKEFGKLAPHVDRWLTNSSFVTGQLTDYLVHRSLQVAPVAKLPMGWNSFAHLAEAETGTEVRPDDDVLGRYGLASKSYILFVGTVEPRKNLSTLLDALDRLRGELGSRVPDLVVIGGWGWRSAEVRTRLLRDRQVHWFRAVVDSDLAAFYRQARFTVAPSHTEGWGLPVQESVAHGIPCIASAGGALPEAGSDLVEYFEPSDMEGLKTAMACWIKDDAGLAQARQKIAHALRHPGLPTWDDAARMLLRHALD